MHLRFEKAKHGSYRLEIRREDGSTDSRELEAGYLAHDLMHFVYETRTGTKAGFYGRLAAGRALDATENMRAHVGPTDRAAVAIEIVVGVLQGGVSPGHAPGLLVERASEMLRAQGHAVPLELDAGLVASVLADLRRLAGRWASLDVSEALELEFDVPA